MSEEGTLHLALHDGFNGDTVVLLVDGREVFRRDGVQTDPRTNLAASVDVPWSGQPERLEVRLPALGLAGESPLGGQAPFVGIFVRDGEVRFRLSEEPFGYM